ncbi:MAG: hypothetical protein JHC80_07400 [Polynucleobacter sp.]|nr:hypothetical protein [Polynucleobacter sp.]
MSLIMTLSGLIHSLEHFLGLKIRIVASQEKQLQDWIQSESDLVACENQAIDHFEKLNFVSANTSSSSSLQPLCQIKQIDQNAQYQLFKVRSGDYFLFESTILFDIQDGKKLRLNWRQFYRSESID